MAKPEPNQDSTEGRRVYLYGKVEEFLKEVEGKAYFNLENMEEEFKNWLWGTSHG